VAGRPRVLDAEGEATLDAILDAGLDQASAAAALGISIRSVQRYEAARRRRPKPPQDLDSLLAALADTPIEQALEELRSPPPPKPRARSRGRRRRPPRRPHLLRPLRRSRSSLWAREAATLTVRRNTERAIKDRPSGAALTDTRPDFDQTCMED
jgi:transcriptional regulator with XRE-family HTH domain